MNWTGIGGWISGFASQHKEALGLFALAMAVTMRPKLPWPFVLIEPLEWAYEWLRDGLLTFVSMRGPAHSEASGQQTTKTVIDPKGKTVETSVEKTEVASTHATDSAGPQV